MKKLLLLIALTLLSGTIGKAQCNTVSFSATPTFTASNQVVNCWTITLTNNVTSSSFASLSATTQILILKISQDSSGGHSFVQPTNADAFPLCTLASSVTTVLFAWDGTNANIVGAPKCSAFVEVGAVTATPMARVISNTSGVGGGDGGAGGNFTIGPIAAVPTLAANQTWTGINQLAAATEVQTTHALDFQRTNNATTGCSNNHIAMDDGAGLCIIATAATTNPLLGIVDSGGATSGSANIAYAGQLNCVFDSSSAITIGHWVGLSATTNGDCADVGTTKPSHPVAIAAASGASGATLLVQVVGGPQ